MKEVLNKYFENLTDEQVKAVNFDSPRIGVIASAGSGKTKVLTSRIIKTLVEGKAEIDEIVAITFTEKSAMEMKSRLRDAFSFFAKNSRDDPDQLTLWRHRENMLETAQISTIHSFCAKILRQYSLRLGLDPEFSIVDEVENIIQLDRFLRERLQTYLESNDIAITLATELSTSGLRQILFQLLSNYIFVTPHASRSKELPDTEFYAELHNRLVEEYNSLVRDKLKGISTLVLISELRKLEGIIPSESEHPLEQKRVYLLNLLEELRKRQVKGEELNTYISELTQFFNSLKGRRSKYRLDSHIKSKFDKVIKKIWDSSKNGRGLLNKLYIENFNVPNREKIFSLTKNLLTLFSYIAEEWKEYKKAQNILTFDDLIYLCVEFLERVPEVCKEVSSGIKYLFVDEFQDTDSLQVKLIDLLLKANPEMNFFFVGDAKQSIYMFRGAEVGVFQKEKDRAHEKINLTVNFRSAPEILEFVNSFFSDTNFLFEVEEPYIEMKSVRPKYNEPRVEILWTKNSKIVDSPSVDKIVEVEAQGIAERIIELINGDVRILENSNASMKTVKFGDIALLFRTTTHIYKYEKVLKDRGIPCRVVCGRGFFDVVEVKELMTFLEVLINPFNYPALLGFLRGPFCALSDEEILKWRIYKPLEELLVGVDYPPEVNDECYKKVRNLYNFFRPKLGMPLEDLILSIIEHTGYDAILIAQEFGEQKVANIQKFISLVRAYSRNRTMNLFNFNLFLEEVKNKILEGEADIFISPEDAVVLTTVHKAKGLEFPIVFLPHLFSEAKGEARLRVDFHKDLGVIVKIDKSLRPLTLESDSGLHENPWSDIIRLKNEVENEHEYVRLLYVALTRARDYLILCVPEYALEKRGNSWLSLLDSNYSFGRNNSHLYRIVEKDTAQSTKISIKEEKEINIFDNFLSPIAINIRDFTNSEVVSATELVSWEINHYSAKDREIISSWDSEFSEGVSDIDWGLIVHNLMKRWDFSKDRASDGFFEGLSFPEGVKCKLYRFAEIMPTKKFYSRLKATPPVYRELPFIWSVRELENLLIRGIVDAVLSDGTIVDYKTGSATEDALERYWRQLKLYYFALAESNIFVNGNLMLIFIDEDKVYNKIVIPGDRERIIFGIKDIIESQLTERQV